MSLLFVHVQKVRLKPWRFRFCQFSFATTTTDTNPEFHLSHPINNVNATQQLKALYSKPNQNNSTRQRQSLSHTKSERAISRALHIISNLNEPPNHYVINTFLKVIFHHNSPETALSTWDMITTSSSSQISYPLLLKCCVHVRGPLFAMNKCIDILHWIRESERNYNKFEIIDYSVSVSHLLSRCSSKSEVECIWSLINENENDVYIKTAVINAFRKHSDNLSIPRLVFDSVADRDKDVVIVGAMMQCLMHHQYHEEALNLYSKYSRFNNEISHILAIKAYANLGDLNRAKSIFSESTNSPKHKNFQKIQSLESRQSPKEQRKFVEIHNVMMDVYGQFSDVQSAQNVFDSIPDTLKDAVSISTIMKCHIQNNQHSEAISVYNLYGSKCNDVCHSFALKAIITGDGGDGHDDKLEDISLALNVLSAFRDAHRANINLNTTMTALLNMKQYQNAMTLYDHFQRIHDEISHLLAIKCCVHIVPDGLHRGRAIHRKIEKVIKSLNDQTMIRKLKTALIDLYGVHGVMDDAETVFNSMMSLSSNNNGNKSTLDTVSMNAMVTALLNTGHFERALVIYSEFESLHNDVSHLLAIKAAMNSKDYDLGKQIVSKVETQRSIGTNTSSHSIELMTTMIDFYGECNDVTSAERVYHDITPNARNVVSVNAMIKCYVNNHHNDKGMLLYRQYHSLINAVSHISALKACMNLHDLEKGEEIIAHIMENKYYFNDEGHTELQAIMIEFYGYFKNIKKALQMFHSVRNSSDRIMLVNAVLSAYNHCKLGEDAIDFFGNTMVNEYANGLRANVTSYCLLLKAATQGTLVRAGQDIHHELRDDESLQWMLKEKEVQMALISFYGKVGMMRECEKVFDGVDEEWKRTESEVWNVMIHAFGRNNEMEKAQAKWNEMEKEYGITPDAWTYRKFISGCSVAGNVKDAQSMWKGIEDQVIKYDSYVVTTMMDCLSRKGMLDEAMELWMEYEREKKVENHPNDKKMLMAMMSGCSKHKEGEIGEKVYAEIKRRGEDKKNNMHQGNVSAAFVLLSNIYSSDRFKHES